MHSRGKEPFHLASWPGSPLPPWVRLGGRKVARGPWYPVSPLRAFDRATPRPLSGHRLSRARGAAERLKWAAPQSSLAAFNVAWAGEGRRPIDTRQSALTGHRRMRRATAHPRLAPCQAKWGQVSHVPSARRRVCRSCMSPQKPPKN